MTGWVRTYFILRAQSQFEQKSEMRQQTAVVGEGEDRTIQRRQGGIAVNI